MADFIWRALLGGLCVALVAGPLGCVVIWRRMAYFGAALSHSALLGVALGFFLEINPSLAIFLLCLLFALGLNLLEKQQQFASDTLLGILAHSSLALGLVLLAFMENLRLDLMAYLFGDILAVTTNDVYWMLGLVVFCYIVLALIWRNLLALTINQELAAAEGINVARTRLLLMLLLASFIAIGMKVVGMLLIISLLIIPAAAARKLARTPEQMAVIAAALGVVSVLLGLATSLFWDIPAGPAIVVWASLIFTLQLMLPNTEA